MTRRRVVELLIGLALIAVSLLGVLYQVNEAAGGSVPRLLCPLH
ncbi:MAG TPA: hypothetical protein VNS09_03040 [Solirubrobacter sp.]|nr:hypothetical protein [Solirubrobacter sp.]